MRGRTLPFMAFLHAVCRTGHEQPVVLNLIVFKLAFGFTLSVNAAQIICVILSFVLYSKTCKGL